MSHSSPSTPRATEQVVSLQKHGPQDKLVTDGYGFLELGSILFVIIAIPVSTMNITKSNQQF